MASWKKVILSGSNAVLNTVVASSFTGSLQGTGSYALQALTASYALNTDIFPYTGVAEVTGSINIQSTGTTNATSILKLQNNTPSVLLDVKDDGELNINTVKYSNNGVLTNNNGVVTEVVGWSGIININQPTPNPPIQIQVDNGIIINVI